MTGYYGRKIDIIRRAFVDRPSTVDAIAAMATLPGLIEFCVVDPLTVSGAGTTLSVASMLPGGTPLVARATMATVVHSAANRPVAGALRSHLTFDGTGEMLWSTFPIGAATPWSLVVVARQTDDRNVINSLTNLVLASSPSSTTNIHVMRIQSNMLNGVVGSSPPGPLSVSVRQPSRCWFGGLQSFDPSGPAKTMTIGVGREVPASVNDAISASNGSNIIYFGGTQAGASNKGDFGMAALFSGVDFFNPANAATLETVRTCVDVLIGDYDYLG